MPRAVGEKALNGEWEEISNYKFQITEDMVLEFEGESCNIIAKDGQVDSFGEKDGHVKKEVRPGYRCYVMKARVLFTRTD